MNSSGFAGNGFISRTELRHVMMNLGEVLTEEECASMVEVSSNSYNPATNRSQFTNMFKRLNRVNPKLFHSGVFQCLSPDRCLFMV